MLIMKLYIYGMVFFIIISVRMEKKNFDLEFSLYFMKT